MLLRCRVLCDVDLLPWPSTLTSLQLPRCPALEGIALPYASSSNHTEMLCNAIMFAEIFVASTGSIESSRST